MGLISRIRKERGGEERGEKRGMVGARLRHVRRGMEGKGR